MSEIPVDIQALEARIAAIEARNRLVSTEKAWEISNSRRVAISVITYVTTLIAFVIPQSIWYLAAFVPVAGYYLSTLSLPWLKSQWEKWCKAS